jgi:hypothetical protein
MGKPQFEVVSRKSGIVEYVEKISGRPFTVEDTPNAEAIVRQTYEAAQKYVEKNERELAEQVKEANAAGIPISVKEYKRVLKEAQSSELVARKGCCGGGKSMGLLSFLKAKLGGKVKQEVAKQRLEICAACEEQTSEGVRLFRVQDDVAYCGVPRLENVLRDEYAEGCGCDLNEMVRYKKTSCPRVKWGPF